MYGTSGDSLLAAHNAGMNVIVKEAMANGRLTPRNDNPNFAVKLQKLEKIASRVTFLENDALRNI